MNGTVFYNMTSFGKNVSVKDGPRGIPGAVGILVRSNLSRKRYSSEICPPDSEILIQRIAVEIARWSFETVSCCVSASFNFFCRHK